MKLTEKQKQALIAIASNERFGTDTLRSSEYNFSVSVLNALVKKGLAEKSKIGTIPVWSVTKSGSKEYYRLCRIYELQELNGDNLIRIDGDLVKISGLDESTVSDILWQARQNKSSAMINAYWFRYEAQAIGM